MTGTQDQTTLTEDGGGPFIQNWDCFTTPSAKDLLVVEQADSSRQVSTFSSNYRATSLGETSARSSSNKTRSSDALRIIKPQSDSVRNSLERASSQLAMAHLRFSDSVLYGRETHVAFLEEKYRNRNHVNRQLVLVSGEAGVGKSAVGLKLKAAVVRQAGFFMAGKFDLQQQDEPYAAFTMICQELCDSLVAHKDNPCGCKNKWQFTFEEIQTKLRDELLSSGDNDELQVLTTVFPDLLRIFGGNYLSTGSGGCLIGYHEAQNQFQHAFRRLIRVLGTFGPVVLFLDDLQWADKASLVLIKSLMTDCQTKDVSAVPSEDNTVESHEGKKQAAEECGLLVLGSYRSEEVNENHGLSTVITELGDLLKDDSSLSLEVSKLRVGNLSIEHLNAMLVDLLLSETLEHTLSLAQCIHSKTKGNVHFVIQFLKSLAYQSNLAAHEDYAIAQLLYFNIGSFKWCWDVDQIKLNQSATKNVIETIQQNLQSLPLGIRKLAPIVACLGASFSYAIFKRVLNHFNALLLEEAEQDALPADIFLENCEREGLLVHDKDRGLVKWNHDQIQEAALICADEQTLSDMRSKLGELLVEEMDQEEVTANIFVVVSNLDQSTANIPENNPKRIMLAELYRTAGDKALTRAAFASAASYLARGVALLPEGHWESHYNLSLSLFSAAAESHSCVGKAEEAQQYCDAICSRDEIPILDKQRAYIVILDTINAGGNTLRAQEKCLEVLAMLGCNFPKCGWTFRALVSLLKTENSVKKLEREIPNLPIMTNESKKWIMRLLDRLVTFSFQNKSDMFALAIFKGFKYTMKYGISDYSPPILCTVGLLLAAAAVGDLEAGKTFADMSLQMFQRPPDTGNDSQITTRTKSRTLFVAAGFCLHWQTSFTRIRKTLLDGYRCGLTSGDPESAFWSIFCYIDICFNLGVPLALLEKDCRRYTQQMKDLKQEKICLTTSLVWQLIANMLGRTDDLSELDGEAFSRDENVLESDVGHVNRMRIATSFWSGDFQKTVKWVEETGAHKGVLDKVFVGSYGLPPLHFQCAIACIAVFCDTKKSKYKTMALFHAKKIETWRKKGNPNVVHFDRLVQAELLSLKKNFPKSVEMFKDAITLTGRQGILHVQALANERLAEFYLRHDLKSDAMYHFNEAYRLFNE